MRKISSFFTAAGERLSSFLSAVKERIASVERALTAAESYLVPITCFVYSFMLSLGAVYCLVTSQCLPVSHGWTVLGCLLVSAAAAALYTFKHSPIADIIGGAVILLIGFIARKPIISSAYAALMRVGYSYGLVNEKGFNEVAEQNASTTLFVIMLAVLPALMTAWSIMRGATPVLPAAVSFPLYVLSIVWFREEAAAWAVLCWFAALLMIVMTHRVRRHDIGAAAVQSVRLLPLTAALIAAAALVSDPAESIRPRFLDNICDAAAEAAADIGSALFGGGDGVNVFNTGRGLSTQAIDLNELDSNRNSRAEVAKVMSTYYTEIRLRSSSYAGYEDGVWLPMTEEQAAAINSVIYSPLTAPQGRGYLGGISVKTNTVMETILLPYFSGDASLSGTPFGDSYIENTNGITEYGITYGETRNSETMFNPVGDNTAYTQYKKLVYEYYLDIPESTAAILRRLAYEEGIITHEEAIKGEVYDFFDTAKRVAEYIRSSASYSLEAGGPPEGEDFAVWFLTEAEEGYCTHFASAATLMLRAIGIPARMTTGYLVNAPAEQWQSVRSKDAHAWVECYDPTTGWWTLEATPSDGSGEQETTSDSDTLSTTTTTASTTTTVTTTASSAATTAPSAAGQSGPTDVPSASDMPSEMPDKPPEQPQNDNRVGAAAGIIFAVLVAALLVFFLLRQMVIQRRKVRLNTGSSNMRVAAAWDYMLLLEKAGAAEPSERVESIMLKARFSQHEISAQELAEVFDELEHMLKKLESKPQSPAVLYHRYIRFYY